MLFAIVSCGINIIPYNCHFFYTDTIFVRIKFTPKNADFSRYICKNLHRPEKFTLTASAASATIIWYAKM